MVIEPHIIMKHPKPFTYWSWLGLVIMCLFYAYSLNSVDLHFEDALSWFMILSTIVMGHYESMIRNLTRKLEQDKEGINTLGKN